MVSICLKGKLGCGAQFGLNLLKKLYSRNLNQRNFFDTVINISEDKSNVSCKDRLRFFVDEEDAGSIKY